MRDIIYHVATTLDGFIARPDGSIDGFPGEGDHVDEYLEQLQAYDTVIMGRRTYEFGYRFGLQPGARAYPHMQHFVFSSSLQLGDDAQVEVVRTEPWQRLAEIRATEGSDIYLCGGGTFAGSLLRRRLIHRLVLKMNPIVFGTGIPLFAGEPMDQQFALRDSKAYASGVVLLTYDVIS